MARYPLFGSTDRRRPSAKTMGEVGQCHSGLNRHKQPHQLVTKTAELRYSSLSYGAFSMKHELSECGISIDVSALKRLLPPSYLPRTSVRFMILEDTPPLSFTLQGIPHGDGETSMQRPPGYPRSHVHRVECQPRSQPPPKRASNPQKPHTPFPPRHRNTFSKPA